MEKEGGREQKMKNEERSSESVEGSPDPQPGHVQRFCVILVLGLSLVGPSSFDCVYNFSKASSQHKYTVGCSDFDFFSHFEV